MSTRVNHAILHVFDFNSCVNVFSEEELDLSQRQTKNYVATHARRALGNIDNKHGEFAPTSLFAEELRAHKRGLKSFTELSIQIAEFMAGELSHQDKPVSTDLLVVDFEEDADVARVQAAVAAEAAREGDVDADDVEKGALEEAFSAAAKRYFALLLLESKQAYMHEVGHGDGGAPRGEIARHYAILPNPSQKVASYAIIDMETLSVLFCDKPRSIAGEERMLIPEGLLQCSVEASSKEVIETVARIVEEVADEFGANAAVALSKAKAYVSEKADEEEFLAPWEVGASAAPFRRGRGRGEPSRPRARGEEGGSARGEESQDPHRYGHRDHVSFRVRPQLRFHRIRQHPERTDSNRAEEHRQHREQIAGQRRARRRVLPRVCFAGPCACVSCYHGFECVTPSFSV